MPHDNRRMVAHNAEVIKIYFCALFNIDRLQVKQFLKWTMSSNTIPTKKIDCVMRFEARAGSRPSNLTTFAILHDPKHQEIVTEQVGRYCEHLSLIRQCPKNPSLPHVFYTLFCSGQSSVALSNRGQFQQNVLKSGRRDTVTTRYITNLSILEDYVFNLSLELVEKTIQAEDLKCCRSYVTEILVDGTKQKFSKSKMAFCQDC